MQLSESRRVRKTPFTSRVVEQGAQAFTVYNHMLLPTVFRSLEEDAAHLRTAVQIWDVSVERQVDIRGVDATRLVQWMAPRDLAGIEAGRCVYLPLVDEAGHIVNDPVGLRLAGDHWRLSISDSDVLLWARGLARGARLDVCIHEPDVWPLAVQGPLSDTLMARVFGERVRSIRFFRFDVLPFRGHSFIVARSGWSKQGGFEVYVDDAELGGALFDELMRQGEDLDVRAGCPNLIERVENGLLSFGNDLDAGDSPLEVGLERFLTLEGDIESIGVAALREQKDRGISRELLGLSIEIETPQRLLDHGISGCPHSEIRTQVYSPGQGRQLAVAMLEGELRHAEHVDVELVGGGQLRMNVSRLPFDFTTATG